MLKSSYFALSAIRKMHFSISVLNAILPIAFV
jgi:hypothetical protein